MKISKTNSHKTIDGQISSVKKVAKPDRVEKVDKSDRVERVGSSTDDVVTLSKDALDAAEEIEKVDPVAAADGYLPDPMKTSEAIIAKEIGHLF